ncbi:MAG TPA: CvpA family protein [Nevskia sp.]|nr:CvpA family protein [Nevskia sp.]
MAWVDYVFVGIVLLSVLWGALRGFIREALSLAAWVLAFAVALGYGPEFSERLKPTIASDPLRLIAGYAIPFFGVLLIGGLLIWIISMVVRGAGLAPLDRMLGSAFGLLRGGLIVLALVIVAGFSALGRESWWKQSEIVPQIQPFAKEVQTLIPARWLAYLQAQQPAPRGSVHPSEK